MALPVGLLPVFAFVLTVGISVAVTLGTHLFYRSGHGSGSGTASRNGNGRGTEGETGSFASALRAAVLEAGALYLVGVLVIWSIAGGLSLWEVAATLVVAGLVDLLVLLALPLKVGEWLIRKARDVESDTALRFSTYGWPFAMLAVFGIFLAPGGVSHGHLLDLISPEFCLLGFCGIPVGVAAAVLLELVVALLGPGIVGLTLYSSVTGRRSADSSSYF